MLGAGVVDAVGDPGRAVLVAEDHDVRGVDRHVLVDDAALHLLATGLLVALGGVDVLDDHPVLSGDDPHDAKKLTQPITTTQGGFSVGVSIGHASYPEEGKTLEELIYIADERMFEDKKQNIPSN